MISINKNINLKEWSEEESRELLIKLINNLDVCENESRKVNFIADQSISPCDGCPNKGKVCHCILGGPIIY